MEKPNKRHAERYAAALEAHDEQEMQEILGNLDLTEKDITGKTILDIGSGGGEFARWANRHGANVIALDRRLEETTKQRMEFAEAPFVQGTAHMLPFPDNTFDLVVSHASMPNVTVERPGTSNREEAVRLETQSRMQAVREAIRVAKDGGEVRLAPLPEMAGGARETHQTESIKRLVEALRADTGLEVEIAPVPKFPEVDDGENRNWFRLLIRRSAKGEVLP